MKKTILAAAFISLPLTLLTACGVEGENSLESSQWQDVVVRSAAGADAASIDWAVKAYRADLGGDNNLNAAGTQAQGHREINWDGVPAAISSPNNFPGDTFRNRGLLISVPGNRLQVTTSVAEAGQAQPLFGNLNRAFPDLFQTFSPQKLFAPVSSTVTELTFVVPGSNTKATVAGFGAVFTDVDLAGVSRIEYLDGRDGVVHTEWVKNVPWKNKSLSFVGVTFKSKKIAKVRIYSGNVNLGGGYWGEDNKKDAVALDDFLYAEPKAVQW